MRGITFSHIQVSEDTQVLFGYANLNLPTPILIWGTYFCSSLTIILNLHFCFTSSFILKLPTVAYFFKICQSTGQSRSEGNSRRCSKQISEWEVIISHQTTLPANCCQMLAGVALPVSSYTQPWQTASELFGSLPLFWNSAWTGKR